MQGSNTQSATDTGLIGHNCSTLVRADVAHLRLLGGDPRTYSERDITLAVEVLRQLPSSAPLPVVVNDQNEVLVGGLFVSAARKVGLKGLQIVRHDGFSEIDQKHTQSRSISYSAKETGIRWHSMPGYTSLKSK